MKEVGEAEALIAADPKLADLVGRLVEALHPERIYLFGSRARGDNRQDSDYDVLVLMEHQDQDRHRLETEAYGRLHRFGAPVDVLVMAPSFYEWRKVVVMSLPGTVAREGKLLYVA